MSRPILITAAVFALLVAAFSFGYRRGRGDTPAPQIIRDTIRERDTIRYEVPRIVTSYIVDTITMEVLTVQHDTVLVQLPREEKTYEDSLYTAIVSGIQPKLDYLAIYPERQIVTVTERVEVPRATRWGLGLQAGYGFTVADKKVTAAPYVGVGLSYNLITF